MLIISEVTPEWYSQWEDEKDYRIMVLQNEGIRPLFNDAVSILMTGWS